MTKTNKFSNLTRLNLTNIFIVLRYLVKTFLKLKPSQKENTIYIYYNYLINSNGYFLTETDEYYISKFKNNFTKIIKMRKSPSSDLDVFQQVYGWEDYKEVVKEYKKWFTNSFFKRHLRFYWTI